MSKEKDSPQVMPTAEPEWGQNSQDNFGYASDEERRAKRGLEDWELVEKIPESQKGIPFCLSFPFWGNRPGVHPDWFNWGLIAAVFYIAAASAMIYFMVHLYGSSSGGKLDSDKDEKKETDE